MNESRRDVKSVMFLVTHVSLQLISRLTVMPLLVIRIKVMPHLSQTQVINRLIVMSLLVIRIKVMPHLSQTQVINRLIVMSLLVIRVKVMPLPPPPQTHMRCPLKTQIPQLRQIQIPQTRQTQMSQPLIPQLRVN
jgi:hypothetical protein